MTRLLCLVVLLILVLLEIGPVPITGLFLTWIVLFRPIWFYLLVQRIYKGAIPTTETDKLLAKDERQELVEQLIKHARDRSRQIHNSIETLGQKDKTEES